MINRDNVASIMGSDVFDADGDKIGGVGQVYLDDATGDSAIIEYLDGRPKVYHSKDFRVMTNSPTFDQQLELVKKFEGLGGAEPLPAITPCRVRWGIVGAAPGSWGSEAEAGGRLWDATGSSPASSAAHRPSTTASPANTTMRWMWS